MNSIPIFKVQLRSMRVWEVESPTGETIEQFVGVNAGQKAWTLCIKLNRAIAMAYDCGKSQLVA